MSDQQDQRVKEDDLNPVIMKGNLSFSHGLPVWNGLWNYRISNISDQIKQKRVFHYTRTSLVPPFLDNECKGNLNKLYEGPENSSTENDVYLENRKFLLLCELSGVYEGSFVFESVRYAINETFCLCYPNKELQFQRYFLNNEEFKPLDHVLFFEGFGENEFGLFNCSVAVNIWTGYIELLKLYSNPIVGPSVNILTMNPSDVIEMARSKRQKHYNGNYQNRCSVCMCPASSSSPLVKCIRCNIYVHQSCYKIPYTNHLLNSWICDSCMYNYVDIQNYLLSIPSLPERLLPSTKLEEEHDHHEDSKPSNSMPPKNEPSAQPVKSVKRVDDSSFDLEYSAPNAMNGPRCCLCPWPGNVMKRNKDGKWVHALCDLTFQYHVQPSSMDEQYDHSHRPHSQSINEESMDSHALPSNSLDCIIHEAPSSSVQNPTDSTVNMTTTASADYSINNMTTQKPLMMNSSELPSSALYNSTYSKTCFLCHIPYGLTVQCSCEGCMHFVHPLCCHYLHGYVFHSINQDQETVNCYCHQHASSGIELEKQQKNIIKITYSDKNEIYEGEYKNGVREGDGKCVYNDIYVYDGEWSKDKEHGKGSLYLNNKCVYSGDFTEGKISGCGEFYYENGDIYYGNVREGMRHMTGTYISRFNEIYQGEWKEDRKHGNGVYIEENKGSYNGDYAYDMRDGRGVLKLNNGIYYNGNFKNNCMDGSGDIVYSDKSEYRGMFRNGRREGRGTYTWANNVTYEGHFKNDKIDGVGNVIINNYIQANKNEVFIPIMLLQGSLQEIHYSSGLIDHNF